MRARLPLADRAAAAWSFLGRAFFRLAFLAGVAWATVMFMDPCSPGVIVCSAVPLIRQPYTGRGPAWWQRLVLRARLLGLGARQHTARNDVLMLERDLAVYRGLLDTSQHPEERAWLQGELAEISKLHTGCVADEAEASEQIAWAQSDLAKLS